MKVDNTQKQPATDFTLRSYIGTPIEIRKTLQSVPMTWLAISCGEPRWGQVWHIRYGTLGKAQYYVV